MRVAAAQVTCVPADVRANIGRLAGLAGRAGADSAELIVFPELAVTGYELAAIAADERLWLRADDPRLDPLRTTGIATVVNCAAPALDGRRPVIATYVYGADGDLLTCYHKQHLFGEEQRWFTAADKDGRFELRGLRFSLATCFDNHFPDLVGRIADDGCDVHLASALYGTGGGVAERASIYPDIAARADVYVVLANHVGRAGPVIGCGRAAVWSPGGALLVQADEQTPMIVTAEIV
ncbi:carbon-nitrogen hydrolase family protein [Nocardia terpenica]|uniref:Hydrolase n=1 Tax=Nocardia terpenica TaxID=455432 RepID=A0A161WPD4_9NOCA|nr:carbon-nitrogen hydrolase family protein [Nocardia terpenica]KZM75015.1 hydrolase [Nocardia terpenica]NQE93312.1 carbon-nitrogen hydrolase family protein [Nocardia terpenica]